MSNIGKPSTINGATNTNTVYVLATPKIDITAKLNPRKFEPTSPTNVFAGLKLNGKKPTIPPANAVIKIIENIVEPFVANIINNDIQEIREIPEDNPSRPSIKLIALVIPTIQPIVSIYENTLLSVIFFSKNGIAIISIFIPHITTITAANTCASNFTNAGTFLTSSIKHVIPNTNIPIKKPNNLIPY